MTRESDTFRELFGLVRVITDLSVDLLGLPPLELKAGVGDGRNSFNMLGVHWAVLVD